jgi:hypothetical protein
VLTQCSHRKSIINQFPGLPPKSSAREDRRAPYAKIMRNERAHIPGVRGRRSTQHMHRERAALVHPRPATYRLLPGTNKCVRAASTDAKASRRSCALHGESASVRGAGRVGRRHNTHPERAQPHPLRCKKCEERRRAPAAVTLSASEFAAFFRP